MQVFLGAVAAVASLGLTYGAAISEAVTADQVRALAHSRRALPNSPNGYTPTFVDCPGDGPSIRLADSLSVNETTWVEKRRNNTIDPLREFLTRMNISGFDAGSYIDNHRNNASALPNVAVAFSGGGWRALSNGAGVLKAYDNRSTNATAPGQIGGLLQVSTYIAGLSGGNRLVGSIYANDFTTVEALQDDTSGDVWQFGNSVLKGPETDGIQVIKTAEYYADLYSDVHGKEDAGFEVSLTDYWGRALSYQLINATDGGPAYTFSSIALSQGFQDASQPFPIVVSDERSPGQVLISAKSTIFEFNPFEMGSFDPSTYGFMPTHYLGTNMTNGQVASGDKCVIGFDNLGFIMGTSSSIFNAAIFELNGTDLDVPGILEDAIKDVLQAIGRSDDDIAEYSPNPFYGWRNGENPSSNEQSLTLVDGGEDDQNIPLSPLIQPVRHVDVIFANDNSADTDNSWPNGSSLVATYERQQGTAIGNGTGFPSIPDQNTFINLGLNTRPTFFGCNASNITTHGSQRPEDVPLIVYLPNYPYVTFSNESTFTLSTNNSYRDAMIANGLNVATMGNGTQESTWPQCVACAILSRSFTRTGTTPPQACQDCYEKHCWNGTFDSSTPAPYNPSPIFPALKLS